MDLWDLAKLLRRRKWISVPLVLLTVAASAYVYKNITPDYKAIGHMTLLPPTESEPDAPNRATQVSPWTVWSLSDALMIYSRRADVRSEFGESGLSEEWTVEVAGTTLPILQLEVVASDANTANATLDRLVEVLTAQLRALQEPYGARGQQGITAKALDIGQNGQIVTSKVKRAVVVTVVVGLVIAAAMTVLVDALIRRRRRPRAAGPAAEVVPQPPPVVHTPSGEGEPPRTPPVEDVRSAADAGAPAAPDSTLVLPLSGNWLGGQRGRSRTGGSGRD